MTDQELKDLVASLAVKGEKVDRQLEELGRKIEKIDRWMEGEIERRRERTDRWLDEYCSEEEDISAYPREFFREEFGKKIRSGGVEYDGKKYSIITTFDRCSSRRGEEFEVGLVLEGEKAVVLIETEEKVNPDFIAKFAKESAGKFRRFFKVYNDYKAYLGIACYSFDEEVLKEAKKHGIGIVRKTADGIEIEAENLKAY